MEDSSRWCSGELEISQGSQVDFTQMKKDWGIPYFGFCEEAWSTRVYFQVICIFFKRCLTVSESVISHFNFNVLDFSAFLHIVTGLLKIT